MIEWWNPRDFTSDDMCERCPHHIADVDDDGDVGNPDGLCLAWEPPVGEDFDPGDGFYPRDECPLLIGPWGVWRSVLVLVEGCAVEIDDRVVDGCFSDRYFRAEATDLLAAAGWSP